MKEADPPAAVFRIARPPDPWAWPDWTFAGPDGTFGNRYDDPVGVYRVLYASSSRVGAFVETLARFRPDVAVVAELADIVGEAGDEEPLPAGVVPAEWLTARCIGAAAVAGSFLDIGAVETLAALRSALAPRVVHYDIADLDAAAIRLSIPRRFTQEISRFVYAQSDTGVRRWAGIAYLSRLGDEIRNWAIFEPADITVIATAALAHDDADLHEALALLGVSLG